MCRSSALVALQTLEAEDQQTPNKRGTHIGRVLSHRPPHSLEGAHVLRECVCVVRILLLSLGLRLRQSAESNDSTPDERHLAPRLRDELVPQLVPERTADLA